jgi:AbrB family looped-hinge helix DNA binding protein
MTTVTVSPKYQVVIPQKIREALGLRPGQKVRVLQYDGRIELVPEVPIEDSRGLLRGMSSAVPREPDRE